jgi:hypothetical protein
MGKEEIIEAFTNYEGDKDALINELTKICGWSDFISNETYKEGKIGELFIKNFDSNNYSIEVKSEVDKYQETGNVFIETHQFCKQKNDWVESGINLTKSDIWAIPFLSNGEPETAIISKTKNIKKLINKIKNDDALHEIFFFEKGRTYKGSPARGYLISINTLLQTKSSRLRALTLISELTFQKTLLEDKLAETIRK